MGSEDTEDDGAGQDAAPEAPTEASSESVTQSAPGSASRSTSESEPDPGSTSGSEPGSSRDTVAAEEPKKRSRKIPAATSSPEPDTKADAKPGGGAKRSPATSTAKSRAATRKVNLANKDSASAGAAAPKKTPRKATKPPLYRRGGFWFLVICAEVLVALLISYRFERTADNVDLAGAKIDTFCADVAAIRAAGDADTTIDIAAADAAFRRQRDAYLLLKQSAPDDLQPDLDRLVKSTEELIEAAESIQKRKLETPEYAGGTADLVTVQVAMEGRLALPNARLELAVRNACNIELNTPSPSTPSTTAPASTPPSTIPPPPPLPPGSVVTVPTSLPGPGESVTTVAPEL